MKQRKPLSIISTKVAIALASTLEYLCSNVMELLFGGQREGDQAKTHQSGNEKG